jgi:hypothetical protein
VTVGWLRLVKEDAASTELGTMSTELPRSMCTDRQFTSITRPVPALVFSKSPSRNGCSKSSKRPAMIDPTAVCMARPSTIEVTPSAAKRPPTLAPQTKEKSTARPTAINTMRPRSTKIDGIRSRHDPCSALRNSAAFIADRMKINNRKPKIVATNFTPVPSPATMLLGS